MFASLLLLLWGLVSFPVALILLVADCGRRASEDKEVRVVETETRKGAVVTRTIRKSYKA